MRTGGAGKSPLHTSSTFISGVFMIQALVFIVALICAAPAIAQPLPAGLDKQNAMVVDTTKGRIVFKLRSDLAPQHAERIKQLAREGYYNNVPFHRVMDGFMAQTGDGEYFNGTCGSRSGNLSRSLRSMTRLLLLCGFSGASLAMSAALALADGVLVVYGARRGRAGG